jgi:hypothetical protein
MQLDTNLPLQFKPAKPINTLEVIGGVNDLRLQQQNQQMNSMKLADLQRQQNAAALSEQEGRQLSQIMVKHGPQDLAGAAEELYSLGTPNAQKLSLEIQQKLESQKTEKLQQQNFQGQIDERNYGLEQAKAADTAKAQTAAETKAAYRDRYFRWLASKDLQPRADYELQFQREEAKAGQAPKFSDVAPGAALVNQDTGQAVFTNPANPPAATNNLTPDRVMVNGVGAEVLRDAKGNYFDANTKQPVTGRITPYIAPPNPRQKGEITPTAEAGLIQNLSKQWEMASKDVSQLYRANTIMQAGMAAARKGDLNAGAQAVLVTFQKFLDPQSVVRESEYARSGEGQSLLNQVRGSVDKLLNGGAGMTLPELEKFAKMAQTINDRLAAEGDSLLSAEKERIKRNADRYNVPIETIIPNYDYAKAGGSSGKSPAAVPSATVKMKAPNGQVSNVPASQVEHYKSLGATVVK